MFLSRLTAHVRHLSTRAGPKPFLSSYNVGVDIAKISRFQNIITSKLKDNQATSEFIPFPTDLDTDRDTVSIGLRRFIRKVFDYREWSRLESELKKYIEASDVNQSLADLARYLAGRWAIKEAAIKAHSYRSLHYRDVIVLYQSDLPDVGPNMNAGAPVVLIKPSQPRVYMTDDVARQRGLLRAGKTGSNTNLKPYRDGKTDMHELQIARVSLSHDGEYAMAVVYALDEPIVEQSLDPIYDHGHGDPIHEPLIGDTIY